MKTEEHISLKKYNTFGLDYTARRIIHPGNEDETLDAISKLSGDEPFLILGGGSNLLFTGDYPGTLIHPVTGEIKIVSEDLDSVVVSAGAGINWDDLVEWTVKNGFYGLENLSLIPGNVGASPVQNIGAYGTEVRDCIEMVEAVSISESKVVSFSNAECGFAYRYSIFKGPEKGRYIVTRVHFRLAKKCRFNLDYGSVRDEVVKLGEVTAENVRHAVINIRRNKLPDPDVIGNAGSFFKNPLVSDSIAAELKKTYPLLPSFPGNDGQVKLAAGWLIEQCGWKGRRMGDAGVHERQALVLVNHGNASGVDIFALSELVKKSVKEKFGIELEPEVEIVNPI